MDHPHGEQATRRMIGIVAASGGPQALEVILSGLPPEFPVPVLVVQSMPSQFLGHFVSRLGERCLIQVIVAEDGQAPEPGKVYMAGTDCRLLIEQGRLRLVADDERVFNHKDVLFRSMAKELGRGAVAVVLTGMGSDGAEGMKAVRDAGGHTIAQDQATSLIYGTPGVAVAIDAACESLPLNEIAPRLIALAANQAK